MRITIHGDLFYYDGLLTIGHIGRGGAVHLDVEGTLWRRDGRHASVHPSKSELKPGDVVVDSARVFHIDTNLRARRAWGSVLEGDT